MEKENLLIDCNIKSVRQRLETTLSNIQYQNLSVMFTTTIKLKSYEFNTIRTNITIHQ